MGSTGGCPTGCRRIIPVIHKKLLRFHLLNHLCGDQRRCRHRTNFPADPFSAATPVIRYRINAFRWEWTSDDQRSGFVWAPRAGVHADDTITSVRPQPRMRARFTIVSRTLPASHNVSSRYR